jgi:DNA segregation ATPase FtsK/SpoIIIE, S-DNA-T family
MVVKKEMMHVGRREGWGILFLAIGLLLLLSLLSYDPFDIRVYGEPPNQPARNLIGPAGAWIGFIVFMTFGIAGYLLPIYSVVAGLILLFRREGRLWAHMIWLTAVYVSLVVLFEMRENGWNSLAERLNIGSHGGVVGYLIGTQGLVRFMGGVGAGIIAWSVVLTGCLFLSNAHPADLMKHCSATILWVRNRVRERIDARKSEQERLTDEAKDINKRRQKLEEAIRKRDEAMAKEKRQTEKTMPLPVPDPEPQPEPTPEPAPPPKPAARKSAPKPAETEEPVAPLSTSEGPSHYVLPPMDLLAPIKVGQDVNYSEDHHSTSTILQETLAEFGIEAQVTNVERGPVVTRYELLPAPGVRVERIANLSNNIALVMKAESVRVQAPIPGKGVVGIEVPNSKSTFVFMREIMETPEWKSGKHALPLALGKDVGGHALIADLADMPHMLIAGATGAGKTVCMNSILAGLLMSRTPDQMRLMLIDPKIVEFSGYEHMPHLVVPVITDAKKVSLGLRWAINEMERRYKILAKAGVRNIKAYNSRTIVRQPDLFEAETGAEPQPREDQPPDRLPYIVIVVDELADLMLVAQAEIENSIARLAQLSRAVGIHMIIATQRPSVNVITGTIKANFPARIAFQVAQKVDSRTILDAIGADKLLGKGDMLFLPPGSSKLIRAQGTMTSDEEIKSIVDYIRQQDGPKYETAIKEKIESSSATLPDMEEDDDMLEAAIEVIRQTRRASTSSLQRRLRIGYTRAARMMDLLEEKGIVGPPQGSDPREILIDLDGEIPRNEEAMAENEKGDA